MEKLWQGWAVDAVKFASETAGKATRSCVFWRSLAGLIVHQGSLAVANLPAPARRRSTPRRRLVWLLHHFRH